MGKTFSTKELSTIEAPVDNRSGTGVFEFTDDFSVFHFGKFPDPIPGKAEACCRMAAFNFDLLARAGVRTHYRGIRSPRYMEITLLRVLDPASHRLMPLDVNHLVPLQVIFRNTLPHGSSVLRRLRLGRAGPEYFGLREPPPPGAVLDSPIVEFTSKLEAIDRYVDRAEARDIGGLDGAQLAEIERITRLVSEVITTRANEVGLLLADGKVEYGRDAEGRLMLVDHAGTPDEARLLLDGAHVGKQVLREYYVGTGLQDEVENWISAGRPRSSWPRPEPMPTEVTESIGEMYRSLCELWTGTRIWGASDLDDVLDRLAGMGLTRRSGGNAGTGDADD